LGTVDSYIKVSKKGYFFIIFYIQDSGFTSNEMKPRSCFYLFWVEIRLLR